METSKNKKTFKLVYGGVMIALATVLSMIKIYELPFGGSITLCSMLPIMFYAYKFGLKWGLFAGFIYGVLQLLLGTGAMKGLDFVTILGSLFFDYLLAFTLLGTAGLFRGKIKANAMAFSAGTVIAAFLRFICHWISGILFFGTYAEWYFGQESMPIGGWILSRFSGFGLSVIYSAIYNAFYMLPEIVLTALAGFLLVQFAGKQLLKRDA